MVNGLISVLMNTAVVIKAGLMLYSVAKTVAITAVGVADSAINERFFRQGRLGTKSCDFDRLPRSRCRLRLHHGDDHSVAS